MKFLFQRVLLMVFLLFLLPGCGGNDNNGNLTVTPSQSSIGSGNANVSFTVQYSNSQVSDYQGTDVTINTTVDGASIDSHTEKFSSNGILIFSYGPISAGSTVVLKAQVGDIVRSGFLTVTASTLSASPGTLNLTGTAAGTSLTSTISGGVATYSPVSTTSSNISATVSGTVLTVTKLNTNTGTASVVVGDSSSPQQTTTITVTY